MALDRSTLDRGDAHFQDAGGWPEACTHMGVFLAWAAKRGLASEDHQSQRARLSAAPGSYVVGECDTKLTPDDFSPEAAVFIRRIYDRYLPHYSNEVVSETGEAYVLGLDESIVARLEDFLDLQLKALAPKAFVGVAPPAAPAAAEPKRVVHAKFGEGVIVAEEGDGEQRKLTIDFEDSGRRTLLARFVEVREG